MNLIQLVESMIPKYCLLFLCLSPIFSVAQEKSPPADPCKNPQSQRELNDCAGFEYKRSDAHLNSIYRKAIEYMTNDQTRSKNKSDARQVEYERSVLMGLKESERAWLNYRDLQCKAAGQQYEGGSMRPMIELQCLTTLTDHRIADLKIIYEDGDRKLE